MNLRSFDLNLLVVFDTLWNYRSASQAAEVLHVTQPTISAALTRLRTFFDDHLFLWDGKKMIPTAKAEVIAPRIKELIEKSNLLVDEAKLDSMLVSRNVVISSVDFAATVLTPYLYDRLNQDAPNVRVDFVDLKTNQTLRSGNAEVDIFIFPENSLPSHGLRSAPLFTDEYVVIASKKNTKYQNELTREQFLSASHVTFSVEPRRVTNYEMMDFAANGIEIKSQILTPSYLLIPSVVARSDAISLLPLKAVLASNWQHELNIFKCPVEVPTLKMAMFWDPIYDNDMLHTWLRQLLLKSANQFENVEKEEEEADNQTE